MSVVDVRTRLVQSLDVEYNRLVRPEESIGVQLPAGMAIPERPPGRR